MLPWVIIFNIISLDGRITGFDTDPDLYYELASKLDVDAVLMGSKTLLTSFNAQPGEVRDEDEEVFTSPQIDPEDNRPLLIVPDTKGKIRFWSEVLKIPYLKDIIVLCSRSTPMDYLDFLDEHFIKYMIVGYQEADLETALEELNKQLGVKVVCVGGGILNGILLRAGLVDEIYMLIEPQLVGGTKSNSIYQAQDLESTEEVIKLSLVKSEKLEDDVVSLQYKVLKKV